MKTLLLLGLIFTAINGFGQGNIFELEPSQSMLMTGKGPGQDGAINPFSGKKSIAEIKNLGKNSIQVRIQNKGEIVSLGDVQKSEKKEFLLEIGDELYLDSTGKTKVKLDFKEYKE